MRHNDANIARFAGALARVILLTLGFAVIATAADAVPAISPTGTARVEREKAEAQAKALKRKLCDRMQARDQKHRSVLIAALLSGATGTGARAKPCPRPRVL